MTRFIVIEVDLIERVIKKCRNHRRMLEKIRRVMEWTKKDSVKVISIIPEEPIKKIRYTPRNKRISFSADENTSLPIGTIRNRSQVIFERRSLDPLDEPKIERFFSRDTVHKIFTSTFMLEFIIIGAGKSVELMALGLLHRGYNVTILEDAVRYPGMTKKELDLDLRKIAAKGGRIETCSNLLGATHLWKVSVCKCKKRQS